MNEPRRGMIAVVAMPALDAAIAGMKKAGRFSCCGKAKSPDMSGLFNLAERGGFEPPLGY